MIGQPLAWLHIEKQMVKVIEVNYMDKYITYYDCRNCKTTSDVVDLVFNHPPNTDCVFENCDILWPLGIKDKNGVELYTGQIVRYKQSIHTTIGTVKFGEYEQDGSGGEYKAPTCLGFYIQRAYIVPEKWEKEIGGPYYRSEDDRVSPYEVDDIEVIGNIYEHPHLLKEGETVEQRD